MKFTAASVIAALVAVVSSAAIERRGSPLPARFSLEIVSDSPDANGLRVRYEGGDYVTQHLDAPEAIFLGGPDKHVNMDHSVFPIQDTQFDHGGQRQLSVFFFGRTKLSIHSVEYQEDMGAHGLPYTTQFVSLDGMLRPVDKDGALYELHWAGCGNFWDTSKDGVHDVMIIWNGQDFEITCPSIQLKIIEI